MEKTRKKGRYLWYAGITYTVVTLLAIAVHLVMGVVPLGIANQFSISFYVSQRVWSNTLYVIACGFICYWLVRFLYSLHTPRLYRVMAWVVIGSLAGVALFPLCLYPWEVIGDIHNLLARVLLLSLVGHPAIGAVCFRKRPGFLIPQLLVLALEAAVIVTGICFPTLFWLCPALFEYILIYCYLASLALAAKTDPET